MHAPDKRGGRRLYLIKAKFTELPRAEASARVYATKM